MRTTALAVTLRRLRAAFSLGMGRSQQRSGILLLFGLCLAFVASTEDAAAQYRPGFKKYDQQRRLVAAADERGELWSFVYEPDGSRQVWFDGRQVALEKADGTVEAYAYDARGRKIQTRITQKGAAPRYINHAALPEGSWRLPARGGDKVVATAQAARMHAAASVYARDGLGRLTSVTTAEGTTRYRYFEDVGAPLIAEVIHPDGSNDRFDLQTAQAAYDALAAPSAAARVAPPSSNLSGLCSTSGNRFAFGGYRYECELGLYLTPSGRMYDPAIGRFTSQDSYLGRIDEPPSLHRYLYANANPVRYVDPTGHQSADLANEYRIYREGQAAERRREELRRPITSATVTTGASYRFDGDSEKYYLDYVTRNGTEAQRRQAFVHGLGSYSAAYGQRTGKVAATGVAIGVTAGVGAGPLGLGAVATDTLSGSAGGFVSAKLDDAPAEEVVERTVTGGILGGLLGAGTRVGSRWMGGEGATILESETQLTTAEREALRAGASFDPFIKAPERASPEAVERMLGRLPVRGAGDKTSGTLVMDTGGSLELKSGVQGPGEFMPEGFGFFRQPGTATHVEGQGAAAMRLSGATQADLYINNIPCPGPLGCATQLPNMLPPGATMNVFGPNGYSKSFTGVADPRPFPMRVGPWKPNPAGSFTIDNPDLNRPH